jgi:hypothetical protein
MLEPKDKALLNMTSEIGIMPVTQENQPLFQRLAARGLLECAYSKSYRLTDIGR